MHKLDKYLGKIVCRKNNIKKIKIEAIDHYNIKTKGNGTLYIQFKLSNACVLLVLKRQVRVLKHSIKLI